LSRNFTDLLISEHVLNEMSLAALVLVRVSELRMIANCRVIVNVTLVCPSCSVSCV